MFKAKQKKIDLKKIMKMDQKLVKFFFISSINEWKKRKKKLFLVKFILKKEISLYYCEKIKKKNLINVMEKEEEYSSYVSCLLGRRLNDLLRTLKNEKEKS